MKAIKYLVCAVITLSAKKKFRDTPSKYGRTKNGAKVTLRVKVTHCAKMSPCKSDSGLK